MQLGHKIKKLRELKNLTQKHIAEGIGVTQGSYSRMELGETEISNTKLEKIAAILQLKPQDVIAFNESMIFNLMNNEIGNGLVMNNNQLPQAEKNLYQKKIDILKEEVNYLKTLIDKLLLK